MNYPAADAFLSLPRNNQLGLGTPYSLSEHLLNKIMNEKDG